MSYEHSGDIVPSVPNAGCICARCEYLREIPGTGADHIGVYKPDVLDATNAGCSCVRCERLRRSVTAAPPPREGEGEGLPMGDETLKPCPFCGGPAEFLQMTVSMWRARCAGRETCHVAPSAPAFFTKGATAQLWNRRHDEARIRAEAMAERTREIHARLLDDRRFGPRLQGPEELYYEMRVFRFPSGSAVLVTTGKLDGTIVWETNPYNGPLVGPGQKVSRIVIKVED